MLSFFPLEGLAALSAEDSSAVLGDAFKRASRRRKAIYRPWRRKVDHVS